MSNKYKITRPEKKKRKNTKPRISSPKGIAVRYALRLNAFMSHTDKGNTTYKKPGSMNPRKVGR